MIAESMKNKRFTYAAKPMTAKKALIIVACCLKRMTEKILGEVPSIVVKTSKFFPEVIYYIIHLVYRNIHPIAKYEFLMKNSKAPNKDHHSKN